MLMIEKSIIRSSSLVTVLLNTLRLLSRALILLLMQKVFPQTSKVVIQ